MKSLKKKTSATTEAVMRFFGFLKFQPKILLKFLGMGILSVMILLFGGFFAFLMADDNSAEYKQKIDACIAARMPDGAGPKSITDYVCPEGLTAAPHDVAYQVVLDLEFRKMDKELKKELQAYQ